MDEALILILVRVGWALLNVAWLILDLWILITQGRLAWRIRREERREAAKRRKK